MYHEDYRTVHLCGLSFYLFVCLNAQYRTTTAVILSDVITMFLPKGMNIYEETGGSARGAASDVRHYMRKRKLRRGYLLKSNAQAIIYPRPKKPHYYCDDFI